ncbi:MAG: TolC family protein [Deltaproteobacteria bacterium]|nr:TolC family protein [Deltaproteobacteria bacterium]
MRIFSIGLLFLATVGWARDPLVLTPQTVKELLFSQGLGVQLLEARRRAKEEDLPQIKSRFDTLLTLDGDHNIDQSARTSTFFGRRTDTSRWNTGLEKLVPTGTTFGFRFLNEREETTGASAVTGIPSQATYEPILEFRLDQSLGENFLGRLDRAEVRRIKRAIEAQDFQTRHEINKLLKEALAAYWEWAVAGEAVQNGREALTAARDFSKITAEKEALGLVEPTDKLGAQSLVAKRKALVSELESRALEWEARVKTILSLPPGLALRSGSASPEFPKIDEAEAIRSSLKNRFDLKSFRQSLEEKDIQLVIAKNERLPTLDLKNTLQLNEVNTGDYAAAMGDMDSPNWTVALQLKFPLENRGARGRKKQVEWERLQALLQVKQLEEAMIHDVAKKFRQAGLARAALAEQEEAMALEKKKLRAALEEYQRARFSAELILQYQDDYLEARLAALQARKGLALALLALKEAMNKDL